MVGYTSHGSNSARRTIWPRQSQYLSFCRNQPSISRLHAPFKRRQNAFHCLPAARTQPDAGMETLKMLSCGIPAVVIIVAFSPILPLKLSRGYCLHSANYRGTLNSFEMRDYTWIQKQPFWFQLMDHPKLYENMVMFIRAWLVTGRPSIPDPWNSSLQLNRHTPATSVFGSGPANLLRRSWLETQHACFDLILALDTDPKLVAGLIFRKWFSDSLFFGSLG